MTLLRAQIPRLGVAAVLLALLVAPAALAQLPRDFDAESEEWNGLSRLAELAAADDIQLDFSDTLDYSALDPAVPLLLLGPTEGLDIDAIQSFLADGGRVLLADEVGSASDGLLARVEILRFDRLPRGARQRAFRFNPNLPLLKTPGRHALLEGDVERLVGNHPVAYQSELPAVVYYDEPGYGFAFDLTVGEGKMIVVGDASLYINLMLDVADNRAFVRNSLAYLCVGRLSPPPCRVQVYVGAFESTGSYGPESTTSELVKDFEEALDVINETAREIKEMVPERPLLRAMTLLLTMGLSIFCMSIFPLRPPRFLSLSFRPPRRLLPRSEFERHLSEFEREGKRANYALPVAILRDEFERLFYREVFGEGDEPSADRRALPSVIADSVDRASSRLRDLGHQPNERAIAQLLKQMARVPVRSQLFIDLGQRWTEKDLMQLHQQCLELLEQLGVKDDYEQRTGSSHS